MPKVSVVMPLYNNAEHFPEAVESVLNQSFSDFECIVIDDASRDDSPALLRSYARKDRRVRAIFLKENIGVTRVSQIGLEQARAPLVARMDSDDLSLSCRLQKQHDYMQKHEEVGLLGCDFFRFSEDAQGRKRLLGSSGSLPSKREERHRYLTGRPSILCCPSVMFRRKIALGVGGYRKFFANGAEDRDFVLRMHEGTEVANLAEKLYVYRFNPGSSFRKNNLARKAGSIMATYCALRRRCGKEDPLEQAEPLSRLPQVLGFSDKPILEDLQQDPRWMTELLFEWLAEKPFDDNIGARLYLGLIGNRLKGRGGLRRALVCLLRAIELDGILTLRLALSVCLDVFLHLPIWHRNFWQQPKPKPIWEKT